VNLLAPLGLAALAAIPIIVLFHMRHTTPPRRPAPSLRFWEAARPMPADERRFRRPPLSLPLLLQIAAVALLAFALARPATAGPLAALAPGLHAEPRHLLILLDGSTSMSAVAGPADLSRWDAARAEAETRLAALREGDVATVILMGSRSLTFTATDNASLISLRERLATLPQPGGRADLDAALVLAGDLFLPNLDRQAVVISDGATAADASVAAGLGAPVEVVIAGGDTAAAERANLAVIDIAARPDPDGFGADTLSTSIANFGPEQVRVPVTLSGDGLEIGRADLTIDGNGATESLRWILPPGIAELTVRVEQPDPLLADNSATLLPGNASTASIAPRILLVSDLPGSLARALMSIENVQLVIEPGDNVAAVAAGGYDLLVFDRTAPPAETLARVDTPSLWIAPAAGGPFEIGEGAVDPLVTRVRAGDPLLDGVDLAGATFGPTPIFALGSGDEEIVGSADGPLLYRTEANSQPAVVLTIDPEGSNLSKRVAFPVLIANMVAELAPDGIPAAIPLGEALVYEPRTATAAVEITSPADETTLLSIAAETPGNRASRDVVFTDTGVAGAYSVQESDAAGNDLGATRFVVNAGHQRESDLRANPNLAATLANATGLDIVATRLERVDLWPLLALAALAVIAVEWLAALVPSRRGARPRAARGSAT